MNQYTQYLPSRNTVAYIIVPALTIFIIWGIGQIKTTKQDQKKSQQDQFTNALSLARDEYNSRDTDGDLLQDWEEFLYETDIEKMDTDGDGLDDYQEVLDPIRDPLVADAELGRTVAATSTNDVVGGGTYYAYDDSLSATEKLSRDIFNTFSQIQQSDDPALVQKVLLERVPSVIAERENEEFIYTLENIALTASLGETRDRERYARQYNEAVKALQPLQGKKIELKLIEEYGTFKNPQSLQELELYSRAYLEFTNQLLAMQVTSDIAPVHLELINNYDTLSRHTLKMSQAEQDPIAALAGTSAFIDNMIIIETTINALSVYLYGQ